MMWMVFGLVFLVAMIIANIAAEYNPDRLLRVFRLELDEEDEKALI